MAVHAKRKKSKKTHHRHRVGALSMTASSPLVKYGSIAAGFVLGGQINAAIDKVVPANFDNKIVAAGEVGIGYLLALRKGGKKSMLTTVAGGLMLGAGAKRLMTVFGIGSIGGYQMVPAVGGYQMVPAVGNGSARRLNGYTPGPTGINGYRTAKQTIGALEGSGLMNN